MKGKRRGRLCHITPRQFRRRHSNGRESAPPSWKSYPEARNVFRTSLPIISPLPLTCTMRARLTQIATFVTSSMLLPKSSMNFKTLMNARNCVLRAHRSTTSSRIHPASTCVTPLRRVVLYCAVNTRGQCLSYEQQLILHRSSGRSSTTSL